jgi:hypothetical protein
MSAKKSIQPDHMVAEESEAVVHALSAHPKSMKMFGSEFGTQTTQNTQINVRVFCEICVPVKQLAIRFFAGIFWAPNLFAIVKIGFEFLD